jgi:RHS repeat-associated protein
MDQEGRLLKSFKTATPADASNFLYDARWRLASRTVTSAANPAGTFTGFIHDLSDRIIAETDASGNTRREYIWADDIPTAVVGNVATSPTLWMVHTDHLLRPARMTDATGALVWDVIFRPFGEVNNISENPATTDQRFPGQWFQLQNGLAYNWHRHYDASLGRYVSADPLGLTAMLSDGPANYNYAGQVPNAEIDEEGLRYRTQSHWPRMVAPQRPRYSEPATRSRVEPSVHTPGMAPVSVRFRNDPCAPPNGVPLNVHGNSRDSTRPSTVYELWTLQGEYLKTGLSQNLSTRYSKTFMDGKVLVPIQTGNRSDMLRFERDAVMRNPGPMNREPWAGAARCGCE